MAGIIGKTGKGLMGREDDSHNLAARHVLPSPIPLHLESKVQNAFPDATKKASASEETTMPSVRGGEGHARAIDKLLEQATSVLDGGSRIRSKKLEESLEIHRSRAQRRREYENLKDNPRVPHWMTATESHSGAPLKTLDEWLGYNGPKLRSSARELEKQPTVDSFLPRMRENNSQHDSETRANLMARNSEKLRTVEEKLNQIAKKGRHGGMADHEEEKLSYTPDELLSMLTPDDLRAVHGHFNAAGGKMDMTSFVEVVQSHLDASKWKSSAAQVNNIIDLCTQLDINGDGTVTWDAVYEFTVELGKSGSNAWEKIEDMILSYLPAKVSDKRGEADNRTGIKDGEIERMQCLQMMDKIAVLERDSPVIKLYSADTLELTDCLDGHKGAVLRCIHLEGTDYVVSSGADTSLILWGAFTNNKRQVLPTSEVFISLVWDLTRRMLYAGSSGGTVHCFKVPEVTGVDETIEITEEKRFAAHTDVVTDMLVMPDLGLLVTASMDARMHVWDLGVHTLRRTLNAGHNKGVYRLAYVASQRYLISAGFDHYCKVWNPMIEEPLFTMSGHTNVIAGMEVVMGSNRVITSDVDGVVKVWDTRNFTCVQTIKIEGLHGGSVSDLTYVYCMDRVIVAAVGQVSRRVHKMHCLDYEHPMQPEVADEEPIVCGIYSRINHTVTTASARTVRLWNASSGLLWKSFVNIAASNITSMCFDDRERKLVVGEETGAVVIVNYLNGAPIKQLEPHSADVCALAYCAFSKCILSASWGGRVRVHHDVRPDKSKVLRQIDGHSTDVTCMSYSASLSLIATACTGGGVRLWDYEDAKMAGTCQAHTTEVTLLSFLDEYRLLLTGDFLGNLVLWTVSPFKEKHKPVCRWDYLVQDDFDPTKWKRSTPTTVAFHPTAHTLFIGGTSGHVVSYDTSAVVEELMMWQGVDASGKPAPGGSLPPLLPRVFMRNPREGRTKVPEVKRDNNDMESIIKASAGDLSYDITATLEWGKDVMTGQAVAVRLGPERIAPRQCWRAHDDAVKSMQFISHSLDEGEMQRMEASERYEETVKDLMLSRAASSSNKTKAPQAPESAPVALDSLAGASFFMTQDPDDFGTSASAARGEVAGGGKKSGAGGDGGAGGGGRKSGTGKRSSKSKEQEGEQESPEMACILTAGHDQKVCIWSPSGEALGSLRQGDRHKAKMWKFPISANLVSARKERDTQQMLLNVM